jgi:Protein of unknown function (DUF5818)
MTMIRLISFIGFGYLILTSLLWCQQMPSSTPSTPGQGDNVPQQETDTATPHQSARSFEGRIARVGDQFVLEDKAAQTSYRLDDQGKAKKCVGKNVKVMATMDAHSNLLHVIDITNAGPTR